MGLWDVGKLLGSALGVIPQFIISGLENIIKDFGKNVQKIINDNIENFFKEVTTEGSQPRARAGNIMQRYFNIIEGGFDTTKAQVEGAYEYRNYGLVASQTQELWNKINDEVAQASGLGMAIEFASFGMIDQTIRAFNMKDQVRAMTQFAGAKSMIELNARYLQPYEQYFNSLYPYKVPGPSDIVRFALREVFEPTRFKELIQERPGGEYTQLMLQNGYFTDIQDYYWASHWVLPSVGQLNEMLHRRVIDEVTWDRFVKYNDFDPTVRPWLKAISFNPYTRVDVRRMWDLAIVSEQELFSNYLDLGYDQDHASKMTVWTKVYVLASELRARYSKGWITSQDVLQELLNAGMPEDRANIYLQKIVKETQADRTAKERDLTKTDITGSVRKGLITREEGIIRLIDLGYEEDEATFIIEATVTSSKSAELDRDRDLSKTDIIDGMVMRIISDDQGREMLQNLGYDSSEAQYIIDIRVKPRRGEALAKERDLTKAEIVKGVKKQILTWDQGSSMLQDLGYDSFEADYILAINIESLAGSPESWTEFQEIINKHRKAVRLDVRKITPELKKMDQKIIKLEAKYKDAKEKKADRQTLIEINNELAPLKRNFNRLTHNFSNGEEK